MWNHDRVRIFRTLLKGGAPFKPHFSFFKWKHECDLCLELDDRVFNEGKSCFLSWVQRDPIPLCKGPHSYPLKIKGSLLSPGRQFLADYFRILGFPRSLVIVQTLEWQGHWSTCVRAWVSYVSVWTHIGKSCYKHFLEKWVLACSQNPFWLL